VATGLCRPKRQHQGPAVLREAASRMEIAPKCGVCGVRNLILRTREWRYQSVACAGAAMGFFSPQTPQTPHPGQPVTRVTARVTVGKLSPLALTREEKIARSDPLNSVLALRINTDISICRHLVVTYAAN
jgi:hypothetical protein